jgi:CRISPR-associated endonuclease/helicase Cas3
MSEWGAEGFVAFFQALYENDRPFPWQEKLARRVLENTVRPWPQAIALPAASGKSACIDIAVFALAAQAYRPLAVRTAPRRIYYIVDRHVIVDEALDRARHLCAKLAEAKNGILKEVADRLREQGQGEVPLACYALRSGIYRDEAWIRTPLQPTVVATTVNQIGSRLLYRGYGRSAKAWPIHAGLAANDSLYLLDELHCAQPFMETLLAVMRYRTWAEQPLSSPFQAMVMSAAPPAGLEDVLRPSQDDLAHPVLGKRLRASKPVRLIIADKAKGRDWLPHLADKLAQEARGLVKDGRLAIAVMVNRVATARAVYERLVDNDADTVLLTGRMRSLDREDTVDEWLSRLHAAVSGERWLERPVFVVATQTLEVGANLDFDGLVTECASLDALRQRFGRLNRAGRDIPARGVIVVRADQAADSLDDPIYGTALQKTWAWITDEGTQTEIDLGVHALTGLLPHDEAERSRILTELSAPRGPAPVMLPMHLDYLVQTAPVPWPSPEVALFLHGSQAGRPDVQVCWRADLDPEQPFASDGERESAWLDVLSYCPPASAECIPVPLSLLRRWMAGRRPNLESLADVEGAKGSRYYPESGANRPVVRWLGQDESQVTREPGEVRPGDVVVIPARLGGWDVFGHIPVQGGQRWIDLGDRAFFRARAQVLVRLNRTLLSHWPPCLARDRLDAVVTEWRQETVADEQSARAEALRQALHEAATEPLLPKWLCELVLYLTKERNLAARVIPHPCGGLIVCGSSHLPSSVSSVLTGSFTDEDDATASSTVQVALTHHLQGVADVARRFAQGCGLADEIVQDLALAAWAHDLGKADPRFQALLHGGNPWAAAGTLLAKSETMPQGRAAFARARHQAGYPAGARHELLSVRLLENERSLLESAHDRDLVLHLIASHHGHCRPFAPVVNDTAPRRVTFKIEGRCFEVLSATHLERLDSGVPERFWHLVRRYGWWGIAWLEAMLQLADHRRSEAEAAYSIARRKPS